MSVKTAQSEIRLKAKAEKEIRKWEKQKKGSGKKLYFAYIIFIITLIYATDEIASQIGTLMKTEIANDFFSRSSGSVALLDILSILVVPFQAIGLLYRPFADKLGWFGEVFLSYSFLAYIAIIIAVVAVVVIGAAVAVFFIIKKKKAQ